MQLRYLPGPGAAPWSSRTSYRVEQAAAVGDDFVVIGRLLADGNEHDWFVGVYDGDGERVDGSGCVTTASRDRAWDYFAAWVRRRSN